MKKYFLYLLLVTFFTSQAEGKIAPTRLRCENLENPQVIDVSNPRLSWVNIADEGERGQVQTAWEIRVAGTKEKLLGNTADLWNSGKIPSKESNNIRYDGKLLSSRQDCWWQVRTWDSKGIVSDWSEPSFWSMGLLNPAEWKAQWIGAPWQGEEALPDPPRGGRPATVPAAGVVPGATPEGVPGAGLVQGTTTAAGQGAGALQGATPATPAAVAAAPVREWPPAAPMLRKSFSITKEVASARAYVTGLGYFEFYMNGKKVGNDVLVPNLTLYGKRPGLEKAGISVEDNFREYRVMYLSYDLTDLVKKGENVAGAMLGNGFYNAPINWTMSYGTPRFIGQIYVKYTDGSEDIILSDQTWKASKGPIVMDLVYDGEYYDARLEQKGWAESGFDDSKWENVAIRKTPEGKMKAHMSPTDKVMEQIKPVTIIKNRDGKYHVDFGQEISGWVRISGVTGTAGRVIDFEYVCEQPVGKNTYTLKGDGPESYAARFTWFVFREVVVSNWPGNLSADQIIAEAVYSDVETTAEFETSNNLFNKINQIWWRSQTDNMHGGIASDCPHRERSPYTGDGQVAVVTVLQNFDARAFYTKWIQDILGAQNPETGYVPNGAPWQPGCGGGVAWGAAMNIMPWEYYLQYGDIDMLKNNFEGMEGYIKYMLTWTNEAGIMFSQAPDTARPNRWLNLGDWCAPGPLPQDEMVHTFYLWRCADFTAKAAKVLGKTAEADKYNKLAEKTKGAFMDKYYDKEKGSYGPSGGNIFALKMGVPKDQHEKVVAALKADIIAAGGHLDTGIFGTQFFFEVLSENGLHELAYEAMNKRTNPSYGWWIEQGATTTWEQWNGGGSRNHPMFGGGLVWFYRVLAGMSTDQERAGYDNIIYRPQPAGDMTYAKYSNLTPNGEASINWKKDSGKMLLDIVIPVGSTGTVYIPASSSSSVTESGKKIKDNAIIKFLRSENGYAVYSVGSGKYSFASQI